ncbi:MULTISPECIES: immune inhibitor A domain-containing protein [unclassified Solwaraspora]|uniref:immune inhibitor A domain-containing protein n=1 Tax=unclassified Solwaraspora TaxID=2627926 RepID=UPI00248B9675|nr:MULTISPECIES: immune inhibitor A domain-containing protein [unclassified Solwaraspora]WBC00458.1 immune inhibitor A [Solwaraspora sp. WMMA2059]WBC23933.1 immune inhibitor A [Solwaraspora sp. WMMA2080]WJK37838.1 immune inhibitor A [Solwaraspora sp. WMMA2065]
MGMLTVSLASGMGFALPATAMAAPSVDTPVAAPSRAETPSLDDLPNPLGEKRRELRERAVSEVVSGRLTPERRGASTVAKVGETSGTGVAGRAARGGAGSGKDQYVELERETTDRIFVILAEFGNERHPAYPDVDSNPDWDGPARFDGPLHNEIPEPDRTVDNTTIWQADYSPEHYRDLYFGAGEGVESVRTYYETQSSGRYSVEGTVTDWVKVRYNEARYGRDLCGGNVCSNVWQLLRDAANQWVADQQALGRTDEEIAAELREFDKWDRYDFDGDGDFNEADGYIDHFQIVHAGGDQADRDPWQGEDAIWSHRWYAFATDIGLTGPAQNPAGGTQIGDSGLWIGDYTIQPENGGLSVFVHEYGHDLGLPDDYDTSGGGDNNNEHWTLMAQSRLGAATDGGIGERPGDLGAWNKLQLGWLDYEVVVAGQKRTLHLGPQEYNTKRAQAVIVVLPKKEVTTELGEPYAGEMQYFSGNEDDMSNTMTREFDLAGASTAALSMKARYDIEDDYDYLYFQASADGGASWTSLEGTVNGVPYGTDGSGTPAIDSSTGGQWVDINVPLDAYAGDAVLVRLLYRTDGAVAYGGFFGDEMTVTADGAPIFTDGAEGAGGWDLDGWTTVGASVTADYDNYYIAGHRSYVSYDRYLETGPYYFGYADTKPDMVDHYPYQEGLLISYWDTSQVDNNTNVHPGEGRNLYIDSRPRPMYNLTGAPWRARVQVYDAPFSLEKADGFTLHINGEPHWVRGQAAQPLFNDTRKYFYEELPNHGVKLPAVGVKIRVVSVDGTTMKIRVS